MPVYDVTDTILGVVVRVYDHTNLQHPLVGRPRLVRYLDRVPAELLARLHRAGYLEVDSGLLSGDYFVLPHQIANVTDKGVFLLFRCDELIQL
jgi:hypothetical protein